MKIKFILKINVCLEGFSQAIRKAVRQAINFLMTCLNRLELLLKKRGQAGNETEKEVKRGQASYTSIFVAHFPP
jgi:hypothetical protein